MNKENGFNCCEHFWEFRDIQYFDIVYKYNKLALCLKCGNFRQKLSGQLDEEKIENENPYEPELYDQMRKEIMNEKKLNLVDAIEKYRQITIPIQ
ncbi:hypothetical protein HY498_05080 [Candidatus Woesearchaeota archaeon]|nr:hypothetical protein [Candidatus Woesearchaeota archaeon]